MTKLKFIHNLFFVKKCTFAEGNWTCVELHPFVSQVYYSLGSKYITLINTGIN